MLYSFFRALKIDITPPKGASLLNFLVFKQALSMVYLCPAYALSISRLFPVYTVSMLRLALSMPLLCLGYKAIQKNVTKFLKSLGLVYCGMVFFCTFAH